MSQAMSTPAPTAMENPVTNNTTPGNPTYLWMEGPKQRGTTGIVTICISTLVICVWSTVHFSVPTKRRTPGHRFSTKVLWTLIALLAPEFLLYLAIIEWTDAAYLMKKTLASHPRLGKRSTLTCMYNYICGLAWPTDTSPTFGFVHAFYAVTGGFAFLPEYSDNTNTVDESLFALPVQMHAEYRVPTFEALMYVMKHFPHLITNVPEETILDRAQSNSISKALLIVQVGWFCTNCASRLLQRLPLSLLEVSTAAHSLCTLLTYFVWWSKPLNVPAPIILRGKEAREVYALLRCSSEGYNEALGMARRITAGEFSMPIEGEHANIIQAANALLRILQMDKTPEEPQFPSAFEGIVDSFPGSFHVKFRGDPLVGWTITAAYPILYGLVHLLAWSHQFPTPLERRLWRASSVVVTCSGLMGVSLLLVATKLERFVRGSTRRRLQDHSFYPTAFLIPAVHVLVSGFLIAESFRQLFFLDPAVYQLPSWSNNWPHFS